MSTIRSVRCLHDPTQHELASHVIVANTIWRRMKGLLGKNQLSSGDALLLTPCNSVHTLGMHFAIDVLFLGREEEVVHLIQGLQPWHLSPLIWWSHKVLELPEGTLTHCPVQKGDRLLFVE